MSPMAALRLCPACRRVRIPRSARRCLPCDLAHNQQRGSPTARGLEYAYQKQRARILKRDGYICQLCGRPGADSIDHVIPRVLGGGNDEANLRAAHFGCNSARR